jgi:hypothetical protein
MAVMAVMEGWGQNSTPVGKVGKGVVQAIAPPGASTQGLQVGTQRIGGEMSSHKVTTVKQPPIADDAAREALEDILRSRKLFADLLRTAEFQQLPLANQVRIEHAADLFERALEGLAHHYRQAVEIMRATQFKIGAFPRRPKAASARDWANI